MKGDNWGNIVNLQARSNEALSEIVAEGMEIKFKFLRCLGY